MSKVAFPTKAPIEYKTEIHCRFSVGTMKRIAEIAEATGNHMNRTVAILVDAILPYVTIETVTEPHRKVFIQTPDPKVFMATPSAVQDIAAMMQERDAFRPEVGQ